MSVSVPNLDAARERSDVVLIEQDRCVDGYQAPSPTTAPTMGVSTASSLKGAACFALTFAMAAIMI